MTSPTPCPTCKGTGTVTHPPAPGAVNPGAKPRSVYTCGACAGSRVQLPQLAPNPATA